MGKKAIHTTQGGRAVVTFKASTDEYRVTFYDAAGNKVKGATYFTDDRADAIGTAELETARMLAAEAPQTDIRRHVDPQGGLDADEVICNGETAGYIVRVPGSVALYSARNRAGQQIGDCVHGQTVAHDRIIDAWLAEQAAPHRAGIKPENWRTLADTVSLTLPMVSANIVASARAGQLTAGQVQAIADIANGIVRRTYSGYSRTACRALLETMRNYGLIAHR